ncbi:hypothetical protein TNCV_5051711 [Trichonephila clavipes]|nr:hypothetical protein TNCV_5051711 [Trichonephila clavipes]
MCGTHLMFPYPPEPIHIFWLLVACFHGVFKKSVTNPTVQTAPFAKVPALSNMDNKITQVRILKRVTLLFIQRKSRGVDMITGSFGPPLRNALPYDNAASYFEAP